jgi:hypothetical protein
MLLNRRQSVCLLLAGLVAGPACAGWQAIPATLALQPVGETLVMNGIPMEIRAFASSLPLDAAVRQVQDAWQQPGSAQVMRTEMAGWVVLNQALGDEHRSFQVRQESPGVVRGYVALTSPKRGRPFKVAVPLPPDMTPVSVIDSIDNGRVSQQVIAISPRSADASAQSLEAALKAAGWERHVFKKGDNAIIFSANKGTRQFDATLSVEQRGAIVMMNTAEN